MRDLERMIMDLGATLAASGLRLATAESCTGGLVAGALTGVSGSSAWFQGGVVAYANEAKARLLAVDMADIARHGAVSQAVALAMAAGALRALDAQAAVAVTGIAGPTGGTPDKPVGTVWIAWAWPGPTGPLQVAERFLFAGDRAEVRRATVEQAIRGLAERLGRATALA